MGTGNSCVERELPRLLLPARALVVAQYACSFLFALLRDFQAVYCLVRDGIPVGRRVACSDISGSEWFVVNSVEGMCGAVEQRWSRDRDLDSGLNGMRKMELEKIRDVVLGRLGEDASRILELRVATPKFVSTGLWKDRIGSSKK